MDRCSNKLQNWFGESISSTKSRSRDSKVRKNLFSELYLSTYERKFEELYRKRYPSNLVEEELHKEASQTAKELVMQKWCEWFDYLTTLPITVAEDVRSYLCDSDVHCLSKENQIQSGQHHCKSVLSEDARLRLCENSQPVIELIRKWHLGAVAIFLRTNVRESLAVI